MASSACTELLPLAECMVQSLLKMPWRPLDADHDLSVLSGDIARLRDEAARLKEACYDVQDSGAKDLMTLRYTRAQAQIS